MQIIISMALSLITQTFVLATSPPPSGRATRDSGFYVPEDPGRLSPSDPEIILPVDWERPRRSPIERPAYRGKLISTGFTSIFCMSYR